MKKESEKSYRDYFPPRRKTIDYCLLYLMVTSSFLIVMAIFNSATKAPWDLPGHGNACDLENNDAEHNACLYGYQQGTALIKDTGAHNGYPSFKELYPFCKEYYDGDLTSACLSGLLNGATAQTVLNHVKASHNDPNQLLFAFFIVSFATVFGVGILEIKEQYGTTIKDLASQYLPSFLSNRRQQASENDQLITHDPSTSSVSYSHGGDSD